MACESVLNMNDRSFANRDGMINGSNFLYGGNDNACHELEIKSMSLKYK